MSLNFRCQTSDIMEISSTQAVTQRESREEKRREESRKEKSRGVTQSEEQRRENKGAPKGRKVAKSRLAKTAEAEATGERSREKVTKRAHMKNCGLRATFWSCDVEKWSKGVARSTFQDDRYRKLRTPRHFLKLRCGKSQNVWREAYFQVKSAKLPHVRATFWSWDAERSPDVWREAHFQLKIVKIPGVRTILEVRTSFRVYIISFLLSQLIS